MKVIKNGRLVSYSPGQCEAIVNASPYRKEGRCLKIYGVEIYRGNLLCAFHRQKTCAKKIMIAA